MHKKITVVGTGNVGASIAYTLTTNGMASEIVLVDINKGKAEGEAMDILQGTAFCPPVDIHAGEYEDAKGSDIVIITSGIPRKPGQTRLELAQVNVNLMKDIGPKLVAAAPKAVYVVVSNPVDVMTYALLKATNLPATQVIGSGTMLDSARLRSIIAETVGINPKNVHGYVIGEHGDSSVVPWSLTTIAGMEMNAYCDSIGKSGCMNLPAIEEDMRTSGAKVIGLKGATYYAIALSVCRICECILRDTNSVVPVSAMIHNRYGIDDVCLSLPFIIGQHGIRQEINPSLLPEEVENLQKSAQALKEIITQVNL
jgi:L-lactate dehydrogenase